MIDIVPTSGLLRQLLAVVEGSASWTNALLLVFLTYFIIGKVDYYRKTPDVPSVGFPSLPLFSSWVAAIKFMLRPVDMVHEGTKRAKNGLFRIATLQGEYVLVTDRRKVAEYLKAPDSVLNAQDGANDQQQIPFTMGYGVGHRTYHVAVVRGPITKEITAKTPIMLDEAMLAFDDLIGHPREYTPIRLYEAIAMAVARISNRVYVGTEFCRNQEFLQNAADYAQAVVISAEILRPFPSWLKGLVVQLLPVMKHRRNGEKFLGKFIQERLDGKADADGNKPQDLVQWLIDAAPPIERTVPQLAERVMALNVASIHTTTMVFTEALYALASEPDKYFEPLRQEVLDNLDGGEITAKTVSHLPKMESFLRESSRFRDSGLMTMQRNARKNFTFSDGTVMPAGTKIGAPSLILHRDKEVYENPETFDGFRFCAPRYADTKENLVVSTGNNFHTFGHGRHPCPGRFFAVHEMKIMFSLLLTRYDFKLEPGTSPNPFHIATMQITDTELPVLFKLRNI